MRRVIGSVCSQIELVAEVDERRSVQAPKATDLALRILPRERMTSKSENAPEAGSR
jgi:hypothetical protein